MIILEFSLFKLFIKALRQLRQILLLKFPHFVTFEELLEQKKGRALWWDKPPQPLDTMKDDAEAKVPNKAYCYDAN